MINYEGIEYNLDSIIQFQFQALKQLLEALAKRQIDHNILFFGKNKNIVMNFNDNKDNKEKNNIQNEDESNDDDNENNTNKIFIDKINNSGLIKEFIDSQKQLIEHKKIIDELRSRIEAIEKEREREKEKEKEREKEREKEKEKDEINKTKSEIEKHSNKEININKDEKKIKNEEENSDNESINKIKIIEVKEKITDNKNIINPDKKEDIVNELNNNYTDIDNTQNEEPIMLSSENKIIKTTDTKEENYIKTQITAFEDNIKIIKEQIDKIQRQTDVNKKSIDLSQNEINKFRDLIQKLNEDNTSQKENIKYKKFDDDNKLDIFEKKILDIIDQKLKINKNAENNILNNFNSEKEKLKQENEKILSDIKKLVDKNSELEDKIKELPNILLIKKIEEKTKLLELELDECATKKDIKHICDELDKIEKEISKVKSFIVSQNETNEKYREEILKLKNAFDNVKKTFSALNKLLENNSLSQLLSNLNDLSKNMVEKDELNKFMRQINNTISELKMDVNQHNRNLDEIMPLIHKILTMEDLNKLENNLTGLIEKKNADAMGKFADKKEIIKSIKSIESQVKIFMKNLDKEREKEKNESVILASKPVGGYKCASCEAYIGELKDSYTYLPWNKYHGTERPYRLGSSFSRILQGLNIEKTFNPFIHKNLLPGNYKKNQLTNKNCSSVKKEKKFPPLAHIPSEHDMIKNTTIDEPFFMESSSSNKRYQNIKSLWGNNLRTVGNETNYWFKNKNKDKDNSFKGAHNKEFEKMLKISKKVVKTKINKTSEDLDNQYYMPNL